MYQLKRNKSKSRLHEVLNKINAMHDQSTSIGYFKEQQVHPTADMPYATLLDLHTYSDGTQYHRGEIFKHIKPVLGAGGSQGKFFSKLLKSHYMLDNGISLNDTLDDIGKKYQQDGRYVFGNTTFLLETTNPTPLIDTGELYENFAYKTSINYRVVI